MSDRFAGGAAIAIPRRPETAFRPSAPASISGADRELNLCCFPDLIEDSCGDLGLVLRQETTVVLGYPPISAHKMGLVRYEASG